MTIQGIFISGFTQEAPPIPDTLYRNLGIRKISAYFKDLNSIDADAEGTLESTELYDPKGSLILKCTFHIWGNTSQSDTTWWQYNSHGVCEKMKQHMKERWIGEGKSPSIEYEDDFLWRFQYENDSSGSYIRIKEMNETEDSILSESIIYYDSLGRKVKQINSSNGKEQGFTTWDYAPPLMPHRITAGPNHQLLIDDEKETWTIINKESQVSSFSGGDASNVTRTWNEKGQVVEEKSFYGNERTPYINRFKYDDAGRKISEENIFPAMPALKTIYVYGENGLLLLEKGFSDNSESYQIFYYFEFR